MVEPSFIEITEPIDLSQDYGGRELVDPLMDLTTLNPLDVAWSAGFIDGEAAIMINRSYKQITLVLAVSQSNPESLQKLAGMYGGRVVLSNRNVYEWRQFGVRAGYTIKAMQPYLVEKRKHAEIAIHFVENCMGPQWEAKEECYWEMAKLQKKRGNNGRAAEFPE